MNASPDQAGDDDGIQERGILLRWRAVWGHWMYACSQAGREGSGPSADPALHYLHTLSFFIFIATL